MAFDRKLSLLIGSSPEEGQPLEGLEISALSMEFDIERSVTFAENTASFTIYNAATSTRSKVLRRGNSVLFKAGYADDGGLGILFIGNITSATTRRDGANIITEVEAATTRGESLPLRTLPVTLSFAPGTRMSQILQTLAAALLIPLTGVENADAVFPAGLPNGWTYVGPIRGALKYCSDMLSQENVTLFQDNGELVVYDPDGIDGVNIKIVNLRYGSGLIQINDVTKPAEDTGKKGDKKKAKQGPPPKRVAFMTLMNYKIKPNGLVQIQESGTQDGVYILEKARFFGDNFGGPFNVQCEGRAGGALEV